MPDSNFQEGEFRGQVLAELREIKGRFDAFDKRMETLDDQKADRTEIAPIRLVAYGMVSLLVTGLLGIVFTSIVRAAMQNM